MAFNGKEQPILSVGPIVGLDATSDPSTVDSQHVTVLQNVVPQRQMGAYVTTQGRVQFAPALAASNSGDPLKFYTSTTAYQYLVYTQSNGTIYKFASGVAPTVVKNGLSTAGVGTFCASQQWAFFTNGVDTPLKIDQAFNVTNWGIVAPATAPTLKGGVEAQTTSISNSGSPSTTTAASLVTVDPAAQTASQNVSCRQFHSPQTGDPDMWTYYYTCSASGTPTYALWNVTAAAPIDAGSQLGFKVLSISGDTADLKLVGPDGSTLQTWSGITAGTTYNYSNAAAVAGQYTWQVSTDVTAESGTFDSPTTGTYSTTITPELTYYSQGGAGGVTNGQSTTITCNASVAPIDASTEISLTFSNLVVPFDANGTTSYTAVLTDSTGKVWYKQVNIASPITISFFDPSALSGDYTWVVYATVTPTGAGSSSYTCSCDLVATWEQIVSGGLTAGGQYAYLVTFGNTDLESSAGVATDFLALENTAGQASFTLSGTTIVAGSTVTLTFFPNSTSQASGIINYTTVAGDTLVTIAAACATLINEAIAQQGDKNISLPQGGATSDNTGVITFYNTSTNPLPYDGAVTNAGAGNLSIVPAPQTNCAPASVQTAITLTALPVSTDPQVTLRNLYRLGGSEAQYQLVATINDNTTTTYTDTLADSAITGQTLVPHRDVPYAFTDIVAYQDRVWGLGWASSSPYTLEQVCYSLYRQPWGFDTTNQVLVVGENPGNDQIVGGAPLPNMLVVFKRQSAWAISGSSQADYLPIPLFEIGAASKQSIKAAYGMVFWLSPEGIVYVFDGGGAPQDISTLSPSKCSIKGLLDQYTLADYQAAVGFFHKNTYYLSFPTKGVTFGYYIPMQSWFTLTWTATGASYDIANQEVIGLSNTTISQWFAAETDLGAAINATLTTGYAYDPNGGASTARHLIVASPGNGNVNANVTITAYYGNANVTNTQTLSLASSKQVASLPPTLVGQMFQMTVTTSTTTKASISNVTLFAYPKRVLNVKG